MTAAQVHPLRVNVVLWDFAARTSREPVPGVLVAHSMHGFGPSQLVTTSEQSKPLSFADQLQSQLEQ